MVLKNVTLELSLKPFVDLRPEAVRAKCAHLFRQWDALTRHASGVSVLLWTADGSEILDYDGSMDTPIEWARYIGIANSHGNVANDPDGIALHSRSYLYKENPPVHTYATLAAIVRTIKEVGAAQTGKSIRVGATFDPGGEFAKSPFKYERHNEICMANTMGYKSFVCCYATLNADTRKYAGFPSGIPQGTPLGTFLGRQARLFLADLGFDYLWLSNGFGFGMETWKPTGPLFDGRAFDAASAPAIRAQILGFWRAFRAELPIATLIEVRGTNLGTGADLATDAVPLREIYFGGFNVATPPNSPWAAINGDFGIELAGYMSRIAHVPPAKGFPFRFYVHDPWWDNSPWLDRYGREPHDIFLPLAVSRIDERGRIETADQIEFLTADDSHGRMPDQCPNEIIPHILDCLDRKPDAPGLLTWIYPFDEFHDFAVSAPERLPVAFYNDWFIRSAINGGVPLNTVVSSANFVLSMNQNPSLYANTVLTTLVPDANSALEAAILAHLDRGGSAMLYGPVHRAGNKMLDLLGLQVADPLEGEFEIDVPGPVDRYTDAALPRRIRHRSLLSGGPIAHRTAGSANDHLLVLATMRTTGVSLPAATIGRDPHSRGTVCWVRGSNTNEYREPFNDLNPDDPTEFVPGEFLLRQALGALNVTIGFVRRSLAQRSPVLCVSRHRAALFFAGYMPDTTVTLRLALPGGAPLLVGCDAEIADDGSAHYRMPRAWRRECRVLVEQKAGVVSCHEQRTERVGLTRRIRVEGLRDATVRFIPVPGTESQVTFALNPLWPFACGPYAQPTVEELLAGRCLTVRNITGTLLISW